jgi:hypothetical protein
MSKIRIGLILGFAAGYYFGAMAGRERFEQLNRLMGRAAHSPTVDHTAEMAKDVIDLGYEKARHGVRHRLHHNGNGQPDIITPS